MITRLIEILRQVGLEPTAREVAEMIFLAAHLPTSGGASTADQLTGTEKPGAGPMVGSNRATIGKAAVKREARVLADQGGAQPGDLYLPSAGQTSNSTSGVGALQLRAPSASALPNARKIAQALRPLQRRYPSRRRFVLDEEKTVQLICDGGPKSPVLRPAPERWLEVALVIDEGASMRVWRPMVGAFQRLLERQGAFRDVRAWGLDADSGGLRLYREVGLLDESRRLRHRDELLDPDGRRLIVVVSDCVSAGWRNGAAFRLLAHWGGRGPVVLAQVLPQRLWLGTALGQLDAGLNAPTPGAPNHKLQAEPNWWSNEPLAKGVALPVVTLDEWSLTPWARLVAGVGSAYANGLIIPNDPTTETQTVEDDETEERTETAYSPEEMVEKFRAVASPQAYQLACYLAAVPLSFPVMRLVQQALLPNSSQTHLAEFYLSGLLRQVTSANQTVRHPDEIFYEFHNGVRQLLLAALPRRDKLRVLAETSNFLESRLAYAGGFAALAARPGTGGGTSVIDQTSLAFAQLGAQILRQLGGDDESVARLEQVTREVAPKGDAQPIDIGSETVDVQPKSEPGIETSEQKQASAGMPLTDQTIRPDENGATIGIGTPPVSKRADDSLRGYRYACYISYRRGGVTNEFIRSLDNALSAELGAYTDKPIFVDMERMELGEPFEAQLAKGLYYSACMIVVMTPAYFNSHYCLRELMAIKRLEELRQPMVGDQSWGLVIPVLLRGRVPPLAFIQDRQYVDLSDYSPVNHNLLTQQRSYSHIREIAKLIWDRCLKFDGLPEAFTNAEEFKLPSENEIDSFLLPANPPPFFTSADPVAKPRRVFVSSTINDLGEYRQVISRLISSHGFIETAMEFPSTDDTAVVNKSIAEIKACDLFIGVYAWRIGVTPEQDYWDDANSLIEVEYLEAKSLGKPCLIFLASEDAPWPLKLMDKDQSQVRKFRARLQRDVLVSYFSTLSDFEMQAETSLRRWMGHGDVAKTEDDVLSRLELDKTHETNAHIDDAITRDSERNAHKARMGGYIKYENLNTVINREGKVVVMNHEGSGGVIDEHGLLIDTYSFPYGATINILDGGRVEKGQKIAEWDSFSLPILTEVEGAVRWRDMIEGVTFQEETDEVTGLLRTIVMDSSDKKRQPRIEIKNKAGKVIGSYPLPIGSVLMAENDDEVAPGDVIAKIPREITHAEDMVAREIVALENEGHLYSQRGNVERAIVSYEQALAMREKALGPEHPDVATSLNNLARLYYDHGKYEKAMSLYHRALMMREKALGPEHPDVATSLNNLARLYEILKRYDEAMSLYHRALAIQERALGLEHPDVATSLNNLARLYEILKRYDEAMSLYHRALMMREKALGPEHPDVATSLNNLARLYEILKRYDEAELLLRRVLDIHETSTNLRHLAGIYELQGRNEEAQSLIERAVDIEEGAAINLAESAG